MFIKTDINKKNLNRVLLNKKVHAFPKAKAHKAIEVVEEKPVEEKKEEEIAEEIIPEVKKPIKRRTKKEEGEEIIEEINQE